METKVSNSQFCALLFLVTPLVLLLALGGCVSAAQYETAVEQAAKDAKDIEASALEDAPCLIGLGAWSRMDDVRKRKGVFYLCVPDADQYGVELQ